MRNCSFKKLNRVFQSFSMPNFNLTLFISNDQVIYTLYISQVTHWLFHFNLNSFFVCLKDFTFSLFKDQLFLVSVNRNLFDPASVVTYKDGPFRGAAGCYLSYIGYFLVEGKLFQITDVEELDVLFINNTEDVPHNFDSNNGGGEVQSFVGHGFFLCVEDVLHLPHFDFPLGGGDDPAQPIHVNGGDGIVPG